jgi:uncharacterized membrane protein YccF (DUF307 family)
MCALSLLLMIPTLPYITFIYHILKLSVLTNRSKHVTSTTGPTEGYVIYLFIMGYKLCLHMPCNQVYTS